MSLEQIQEALKQVTLNALNAQIELTKKLDQRLQALEIKAAAAVSAALTNQQPTLPTPRTEQDLKDISKLPDCVKELQIFDGNPIQYVSWIHNVESILKDYEIVRNKPIYRAILQSIRQKIRGNADSALISYNIFDDDWVAIKKCLSLHYADKRDLRTLEHQLSNLTQKNASIDEFYANVNHQFSLIVNKIKTEDYTQDTISVLIESYRNRALDVFIRGLNGDLSKMLMIQRPQTLPEAYSSCLEIQNLNYRNLTLHKKEVNNKVVSPINQIFRPKHLSPTTSRFVGQIPAQQKNIGYNAQHQMNNRPPPRPSQPKPPVPMDVDKSIQTRQVNYMNRPTFGNNNYPTKREVNFDNGPNKHQRLYHLETLNEDSNHEEQPFGESAHEEQSYEKNIPYNDSEAYEYLRDQDDENPELNFMTEASLVYHT